MFWEWLEAELIQFRESKAASIAIAFTAKGANIRIGPLVALPSSGAAD
jgi:hypothetical protein